MKKFNLRLVSWCVVLILGSICAYVGAQQLASTKGGVISSSDALESAITLLNHGDPQDATNLIAAIPEGAPEYPVGLCYRALSLYAIGDYKEFLTNMDSPAAQAAAIPSDVREDLDYKQIGALFHVRGFDNLLLKIQAYRARNPRSTRVGAVGEYQMAGLFERGMKRLEEVSRSQDTNQVTLHRADARGNLNQFLSLCSAFNRTNYSAFTNRTLKEDYWRARIMLGDDAAAYNEISPANTADQERFSLLRLQLNARLQPLEWEHNFQLRTNFIGKFPDSASRKRVEFDTVDVSFPLGKKLLTEAGVAQAGGDSVAAANKRAAAHQYFQVERSLLSGLTASKESGIEEQDLFDVQEDLLYGYYLEKDFSSLSSVTASMLAESKPGDLHWLLGKCFIGVLKLNQSAPDKDAAASAFEEVMAVGFKNKPDSDHLVIAAVKWRVRMALSVGDKPRAYQLVQWVQAGNCKNNIKSDFLNEYAGLVGLQK